MSREARLFMLLKVLVGLGGVVTQGISTAFLLSKPVTYFELGVVYSLNLATSLIADYPTGNLSDRYGRKLVFGLGVLAVALEYAAYASLALVRSRAASWDASRRAGVVE